MRTSRSSPAQCIVPLLRPVDDIEDHWREAIEVDGVQVAAADYRQASALRTQPC